MSRLLLLLTFTSSPAWALTTSQHGPYADIGGTAGLEFGPTNPTGGWMAASGVWLGDYDDVYALGKFYGLGLMANGEYGPGFMRHQGLIELRRGVDLLMGGPFVSLGAGVSLDDQGPNPAVLLCLGLKMRKSPYLSWLYRLGAGISHLDQDPTFSLKLTIGGAYSRPSH